MQQTAVGPGRRTGTPTVTDRALAQTARKEDRDVQLAASSRLFGGVRRIAVAVHSNLGLGALEIP